MPAGETVRGFAEHGTTMALFLSAARTKQLQDELLAAGTYDEDTPCVVAYAATWPDELVFECRLGELADRVKEHKLYKHTMVLVGPALASGGTRSHLYHPGHFHEHRKVEDAAMRAELKARDSRLKAAARP
jgi:precorrin-4/cobalt-precorrin-4 C11-methyltransferase